MGSREDILSKLRAAPPPFPDLAPAGKRLPMALVKDTTQDGLLRRFKEYAEKLSAKVYLPENVAAGIDQILAIVGEDKKVLAWGFEHIPLTGLGDALAQRGIVVAAQRDDTARVGITGAEAGLASTGSLILTSGAGKPRAASLLPSVHVAVLTRDQLVPDFETWMAHQREKGLDHFRSRANIFLISGTSRTADIAMEIIMGVHGPGELHIVLLA